MIRTKIAIFVFVFGVVAAAVGYAQTAEPKTGWAKYDGGKVRYIETGRKNANAIILVHGWTCSADFWKASMSAFPKYRVIAIDLPGHGQSDKPRANYTMEYFARAIEAVIKDAKVGHAVLVGHSMGTPVIRQFYRIFPEQTLGLVVVDGPLMPFATKAQMEPFIGPIRADFSKNGPPMVDGMLAPMKDEAMKKMIRQTMLSTPGYVAGSAMDGMADDAIWGNDQIKVPVLAVMNAEGRWPKDNADRYKTIAPNVDYRSWTGVSHFLFMERPTEFNDAVKGFITTNKLL